MAVDEGLATRYAILEQSNEHGQAVEAVVYHQQFFDQAPGIWVCIPLRRIALAK